MRLYMSVAAAVIAALALSPAAAMALDAKSAVDQAKAKGVIGEQADGFLGFVKPSADPALKAAVQEINERRAKAYRDIAAKRGVPVEAAAAAIYANLVQSELKPGEYYKPAGGGWVRK